MPSVIPPSPTLGDQFFWDAIAESRLVFQRCASCGVVRHPPAPMCGECHSVEWDTQESSGHGHVYTWIVSHHPTKPDAEPRVVVLVELDEGIRFVSNLLGVPEADLPEMRRCDRRCPRDAAHRPDRVRRVGCG